MPLKPKKTVMQLEGRCSVEEAEELLQWLQNTPGGRVNLKRCEHLHAAVLQSLLAVRPGVSVGPDDAFLARWVMPLLAQREDTS